MLNELEKLETNLGGVLSMDKPPDALFVVDLRKEQLAIREARRLGIPVVALVDTNCDPDDADYVVPGNDDAIRSCSLVVQAVADAIADGRARVSERELARSNGRPDEEQPAAAEGEPEGAEMPAEVEGTQAEPQEVPAE
jgi:small subunit ribosomal protein S2